MTFDDDIRIIEHKKERVNDEMDGFQFEDGCDWYGCGRWLYGSVRYRTASIPLCRVHSTVLNFGLYSWGITNHGFLYLQSE